MTSKKYFIYKLEDSKNSFVGSCLYDIDDKEKIFKYAKRTNKKIFDKFSNDYIFSILHKNNNKNDDIKKKYISELKPSLNVPLILDKKQKSLHEFKLRNKIRNKELYQNDKIEGYDFVTCPVSDERMVMIKKSYIEKVLHMNYQDYINQYPDLKLICDKRKENISNGLQQIDEESGLSKYELSQEKSKRVLSEVDESGLTGYQKKGLKTKETHLKKIDENGFNGYQRIAKTARSKQIETMYKKGKAISSNKRYEWEAYRWFCIWLSKKHYKNILGDKKTGRAGTKGAYHIDHLYTIFDGYKNKVSPFVIGSLHNLQCMTWEDNISKSRSSSLSLSELYKITNSNKQESEKIFIKIMNIIIEMKNENKKRNSLEIFERYNESKL